MRRSWRDIVDLMEVFNMRLVELGIRLLKSEEARTRSSRLCRMRCTFMSRIRMMYTSRHLRLVQSRSTNHRIMTMGNAHAASRILAETTGTLRQQSNHNET